METLPRIYTKRSRQFNETMVNLPTRGTCINIDSTIDVSQISEPLPSGIKRSREVESLEF